MFGKFGEFWKIMCLKALRILEGDVFKNIGNLEESVWELGGFGRERLRTWRREKKVFEKCLRTLEKGEVFERFEDFWKKMCLRALRILEEKRHVFEKCFKNMETFEENREMFGKCLKI
ncbi:hypothetical protein ACE6H2_025888 [Prunus campanulata]